MENLIKMIKKLPPENKRLFRRIFRVEEVTGKLVIPKSLQNYVKTSFGGLQQVEKQKIVKIINIVTGESSIFNEIRGLRKIEAKSEVGLPKDEMVERKKECFFCNPLDKTPEDVFGRVKGKYCITASNLAKYAEFHAIVVFNRHNPLKFSLEEFSDYFQTSLRWFKEANKVDEKAIYPFFIWNCLWKAGASIIHGHAQITLTRKPHQKVESLRKNIKKYREKYGSEYFEDIFKIHSFLGLGSCLENVKVIVYLTPLKEKEIMVFSKNLNEKFMEVLYKILDYYLKIGVESFNLCIFMPPLKSVKGWEKFPYIARILDRGRLETKTSDIGGMEIYASNIVSTNLLNLAENLKNYFSL